MMYIHRNYLFLFVIFLLIGCAYGPPPKWELYYQTNIDSMKFDSDHFSVVSL